MAATGSPPVGGDRRPKRAKSGGRKKGSLNKATAEIRVLAREHTKAALETLVKLHSKGSTEDIRMRAAKELLDRGHGKPAQTVDVGENLAAALAGMSDEQLEARITHLEKTLGQMTADGSRSR